MALSMQETAKLRAAWGDKLCPHPEITKEKGPMGQDSDYACTQCGDVAWSRDSLRKQGDANQKLIDAQEGEN